MVQLIEKANELHIAPFRPAHAPQIFLVAVGPLSVLILEYYQAPKNAEYLHLSEPHEEFFYWHSWHSILTFLEQTTGGDLVPKANAQ